MRKTRCNKGHDAELNVFEVPQATSLPIEFHTREELPPKQRENFRLLLYNDFPELL
jgi:MoxR-like ATPase